MILLRPRHSCFSSFTGLGWRRSAGWGHQIMELSGRGTGLRQPSFFPTSSPLESYARGARQVGSGCTWIAARFSSSSSSTSSCSATTSTTAPTVNLTGTLYRMATATTAATPTPTGDMVGEESLWSTASLGSHPPVKDERERRIEALSDEMFSRGNVHLKNVERLSALPEGLHSFPEICFIGKPNAGKSSLIACLLHNAVLGRAGKKPGSTRHLKFFNVGDAFALVDTPGYGGWKGRKVQNLPLEKARAFSILFRYLALRHCGGRRQGLKRVYWVMEASATTPMAFQPRDEELLHFLMAEQIPFSVVLSKIDRHWRFYQEYENPERQRHSNRFVVAKDGTPRLPQPTVRPEVEGKGDSLSAGGGGGRRCPSSSPINSPYRSFQSGVRRNMEEIWSFLGSDTVPILGVSANRLQPQRSLNVDALRYDLTRYAVEDIRETERLTLKEVKSLSYAPPTADDIQRVQLHYPLESFVVPQDNNLSLEEMVRRHEAAKQQWILTTGLSDRVTPLQAESCGLAPLAAVGGEHSSAAGPTAAREEEFVLPHSPCEAVRPLVEPPNRTSPAASFARADGTATQTRREEEEEEESRRSIMLAESAKEPLPGPTGLFLSTSDNPTRRTCSPTMVMTTAAAAAEKGKAITGTTCGVAPSTRSTTSSSLPSIARAPSSSSSLFHSTLDKTVDLVGSASVSSVRAMNGVMIPWSLIPPSLETFVEGESDEIGTFASKSGAGALEALLWHEACAEADPTLRGAFLEHRTLEKSLCGMASDPDEQLPLLHPGASARQRSARRKREEATMQKYLENKRKPRSVYLSAEGYMCPWLNSSNGGGGSAVVGASGSGDGRAVAGSGALMKGLKSSGFGGKSYSARTMKHRGRATKKTGFWAT